MPKKPRKRCPFCGKETPRAGYKYCNNACQMEYQYKSGKVSLVADHIDGNWQDNVDSNLRLICPNCDSLSPTYAGLNKGNGRKDRALSKRVEEGRLLAIRRRGNSVVE